MKAALSAVLILSMCGCATIHRHPVLTSTIVTAAFAGSIAATVASSRPGAPKVGTTTVVIPIQGGHVAGFCIVGQTCH